MLWTKVSSYEEMSQYGAAVIYRAVAAAAHRRQLFNLGLATGNTMLRLYELLAAKLNQNNTDLSRLHTYNLDEYVSPDGGSLPPEHALSYRKYMQDNLFSRLEPALGFKPEQAHFPRPEDPAAFDRLLQNNGGLHLQLLGIGFNGHIAFNEPQSEEEISTAAFAALPTRVIGLKALTISTNAKLTAGGDESQVPRQAVTMGMKPILAAAKILLLACFEQQSGVLQRIRQGRVSPELPASYLLQHNNAEIVYTQDKISLE